MSLNITLTTEIQNIPCTKHQLMRNDWAPVCNFVTEKQ